MDNDLFDDIDYTRPSYPPMEANSTITLYKGIMWDTSYRDVRWFNVSNGDQDKFFSSHQPRNYLYQSPIEIGKPLRLDMYCQEAYTYNYCRLRDGRGGYTLYCFINKVEYVNASSCLLYYTVDVFQTWMPYFHFNPCYVERQHATNDAIGANTMEENLECGNYKRDLLGHTDFSSKAKRTVMITVEGNESSREGQLYGGIMSGLKAEFFHNQNKNTIEDAGKFLQAYIDEGTQDQIVSVQMVPDRFNSTTVSNTLDGDTVEFSIPAYSIGAYVPKNNKLFQYPYSYIEVDNTQGEVELYHREYFKNKAKIQFKTYCSVIGNSPEILLVALDYQGLDEDLTTHMSLNGFPMCAWNGDAYKAYLANNSMKNRINLGASVISGGTSLLSGAGNMVGGNVTGGLSQAVNGIAGAAQTIGTIAQEAHNATIAGNKVRGTQSSNAMYGAEKMDFWFYVTHIDESHARYIDSYFTKYGYRVGQITLPNLTGRSRFNYVQTQGMTVTADIPPFDLALINAVFNRGVTLWHTDEYFGDYSKDNVIV